MSSWTFSQDFGNQFKASRSDLESRVDSLKSSSPIDQEVLQDINVELAKLTKKLADATGSLPSYDQRQYEEQLKTLQKALLELQAASKPRSKFAFKRKPQAAAVLPTSKEDKVENLHSPLPTGPVPTTNLTLSSRSFEYVTFDAFPLSPLQHDLTISDLDHCIVNLIPHTPQSNALGDGSPHARLDISALHVHNLTSTILLLPSIHGSVLLHSLSQCILVVGCRQFRMHTSRKVDVYLSIPSTPIIEHCSDIRFAAYPKSIAPLLDLENSKHLSVRDFSHIRSTPSPHWSVLDDGGKTSSWPLNLISERDELRSSLERNLPR